MMVRITFTQLPLVLQKGMRITKNGWQANEESDF